MKKLIFPLVISSFISIVSFAQNIYTFIPKDASNIIDSIRAINLTTNERARAIGTNKISFTSTSLNIIHTANDIKIYPNPSFGQAEIQFYSNQKDKVKIRLTNGAGQIVASTAQHLNQGYHTFNVVTKSDGLYFVQVIGDKHKYVQKFISKGNHSYKNSIRYIGSNLNENREKSVLIDEADVIHFILYSGDKITKIADSPSKSKVYEVEFYECKDADGRNYPIVQIGLQWWMAENLAYLPKVDPVSSYSIDQPCYYVYNFDSDDLTLAKQNTNYFAYGVLYNWPAAVNTKSSSEKDPNEINRTCPSGWHLPGNIEWQQLTDYVSAQKGANIRKHLNANGTMVNGDGDLWWHVDGTDTEGIYDFGFSALPGGFYTNPDGFLNKGVGGYWWSATESSFFPAFNAWYRYMNYAGDTFSVDTGAKYSGYCVRCIKD